MYFSRHKKISWRLIVLLFVFTIVGFFTPFNISPEEITPLVASATHCEFGYVSYDRFLPHDSQVCRTEPIRPIGEIITDIITSPINAAISVITLFFFTLSSLVLMIAGLVLNTSIHLTTVNASLFIQQIEAIQIGWQIFRDVINIAFIFILLYLSILIILRTANFNTNKAITNLVIAGLLINFSLPMTKVLIDASNVITYEFYRPIEEAASNASSALPPIRISDSTIVQDSLGFSGAFMQSLFIATFFPDGQDLSEVMSEVETWIMLILGTLFILVAAFVFFAAGLLLIIRFIVLIVLLMTSPFAFLGLILPQNSTLSSKWWSALWDQLMFAPAFMILSLMSFLVINSTAFRGTGVLSPEGKRFSDLLILGTFGDAVIVMLNFAIVIGLLVAALVISKNMSAKHAKGLTNMATRLAGKASFGLAGFAARNTLGRIAASDRVRSLANSKGNGRFGTRLALRTGAKFLNRTATEKRSFDARAIPGFADLGIDAGKAQKGGYKQAVKDRAKKKEQYAKDYIGAPTEKTDKDTKEAEEAVHEAAQAGDLKESKQRVAEKREEQQQLDKDIEKAREAEENATGFKKQLRTSERVQLENQREEITVEIENESFAKLETAIEELNRLERLRQAEIKQDRKLYAQQNLAKRVPFTRGYIKDNGTIEMARNLLKEKSKKEKYAEELMKLAKKEVEKEQKEQEAEKTETSDEETNS